MSENLIYLISHRLKMISIAIVLVSSIGLLHFFFGQSPTQEFFGIPIGSFECFLLFLFFLALLVVSWVDDQLWKEERKQQLAQEEFYKLSNEIDNYRDALRSSSEDIEGFQRLRETLFVFNAILYKRFGIDCPILLEISLLWSGRNPKKSGESFLTMCICVLWLEI